MSDTEILNLIKSIIKDNEDITTFISVDEISIEHLLAEDLGLDSMNLMSITYELQEKFESLDETQIFEWKTVSDLIEAVAKQ